MTDIKTEAVRHYATLASRTSPRAIAAMVYDKDPGTHTEAELAFLAAIGAADRDWTGALDTANLSFGGGSETWHAVKRLATRQRDADYARALAVFEMHDDDMFAEAAE